MKSKFSAEKITKILEEATYGKTSEVARKYGVSDKTISNWRRKYKGMDSSSVKELKKLNDENARLKRLVARQAYDIECLKEINSKKW